MVRRVSILLLLAACSSPAPASDLNDEILKTLRTYPTDGSYGYHWPKDSSWEGTTQDLFYRGVKICTGDPQKRSYCCGLTYEVFVRSHQSLGRESIGTLSVGQMHELRRRWFGDSTQIPDRRKLVQEALTTMGLGRPVAMDDAKPGDFVQLWRHNGSGHSAIFLEWVRDGGRIVGITYWSSQKSTGGIGTKTERISPSEVKADAIFLARAAR